MTNEEIEFLEEVRDRFRGWRGTEINGDGDNLHDIKGSFDYVKNTMESYGIAGTKYGENLVAKATDASNILEELATIFQNLENAITLFCEQQTQNNAGTSIFV